jgi:uncharacterized protein YvpB
MVLGYLGRHEPYEFLVKVVGTRWFGTPADNVLCLERIDVTVTLTELSLTEIEAHLRAGRPVIAYVDTAELPYWSASADHAVVVVGVDEEWVYLNDPYFEDAPQSVSHIAFRLAQLRFDNRCALLALK